jgi:chromosomal replication initiation ATPase DnaA
MGSRMSAVSPACQKKPPASARPSESYLLDDTTPEKRAAICEAVIDVCAALFNVSGRELRSARRCTQSVARVRQIAMYLCNIALGISLTTIGRAFARDRTTVGHAVQTIEDLRDDREFDRVLDHAEAIIRAAFLREGVHHG